MLADAPPAVIRAAREFERTTRGIVTFMYDRNLSVSAGPMRRHDELAFYGVSVDGRLVKVRVVRDTIGGKNADASQVASTAHSYEHPKPGDVFEAPFDPRFLARYSYRVLNEHTIQFAPLHPAYGLGSGTFTIDAHANVVGYRYAPSVLPSHATSGSIVDERRQVLRGYWTVTHETQSYSGSYTVFGANGTVQIGITGFRRYPNLAAAERAVAVPAR
jgi:hypothetical protein